MRQAIERAHKDEREGKSPSTQAGEFVREEFRHIRKGKHGARSARQAIAIGLSMARRAGVKLRPPPRGRFSKKVRRQAERDYEKGQRYRNRYVFRRRARATVGLLRRKGHRAASTIVVSRRTRTAVRYRTSSGRSMAARKTVRTKGRAGVFAARRKTARTRTSR